MSGSVDGFEIDPLRAKLDRERLKVRKLVEVQSRLSEQRAAWLAERRGLHRQLAVAESQRRLLLADPARGGGAGARLRVLLVGPRRKTIFEFMAEGLLTTDPEQGPFDLVVIPRPEKQDLARLQDIIPETVWRTVRAGRARIVLDGSSEGRLHRLVLESFRSLAGRTGIPLGAMTYLIQDRLAGHPEASAGPRLELPLPALHYDYYLHKILFPMLKQGPALFTGRLKRYLSAQRFGRRAFLSLNLSPRAHKVLLLARLLRDGLWNKGFISFGGLAPGTGHEDRPSQASGPIDWRGFEAARDVLAPWIEALRDKGPVLFGLPAGAAPETIARKALRAEDLQEYRRSWFTVVTETEMRADMLRITEKVLKPVLNFHPFVVLGTPGALRLIRSYGLETFPEVFDESYDDEEDPVRRFDHVYDQVRRLASLDEADLDRLDASVSEKVIFNARWGLTSLPRIFQDTILPAAVQRLLPLAAHPGLSS